MMVPVRCCMIVSVRKVLHDVSFRKVLHDGTC